MACSGRGMLGEKMAPGVCSCTQQQPRTWFHRMLRACLFRGTGGGGGHATACHIVCHASAARTQVGLTRSQMPHSTSLLALSLRRSRFKQAAWNATGQQSHRKSFVASPFLRHTQHTVILKPTSPWLAASVRSCSPNEPDAGSHGVPHGVPYTCMGQHLLACSALQIRVGPGAWAWTPPTTREALAVQTHTAHATCPPHLRSPRAYPSYTPQSLLAQ